MDRTPLPLRRASPPTPAASGRRKPSSLPLRRAAAAALAGALALLAPAFAADPSDLPDVPIVETIEVRLRPVPRSLRLDATLQAVQQSTVAAQVGGVVVERPVRAGDVVRAGQTLARIDERDAQAALARSEAAIAQARAERVDAQAAWERSRTLVDRGFLSRAALDAAQARLAAARAAEQQAVAVARQAALAREFTRVVAPYDGLVLATHVETGDLAAPGRAVATVYAPDTLRAVVHVPLSMLATVREARNVVVQFASGETAVPAQRILVPGVDPVSQTRELRLEFGDAPRAAVPGQRAHVLFDGATALRRTVPRRAVLHRGELEAVYVARADRFVLRAVRLGAVHGDEVEVLGGLAEGERVALDPVRAGLASAQPGAVAR